jgi:hypothetical protein
MEVDSLGTAGLAKLEHQPGEEFMRLFIRTSTAMQLERFTPQELANVINGKHHQVEVLMRHAPNRNLEL